MFASNQQFAVTCDDRQLKKVLQLALWLHNDRGQRELGYQLTEDGRFAIGWKTPGQETGWLSFISPVPSLDSLVEIVRQFAKTHPDQSTEWDDCDGACSQGYLVEAIERTLAEEKDGIKQPFYGIVTVRSFVNYYAK